MCNAFTLTLNRRFHKCNYLFNLRFGKANDVKTLGAVILFFFSRICIEVIPQHFPSTTSILKLQPQKTHCCQSLQRWH